MPPIRGNITCWLAQDSRRLVLEFKGETLQMLGLMRKMYPGSLRQKKGKDGESHLVEHQDLGLSQQGTRHAQQLALPCAQICATLSDVCIQTPLHLPH